MNKIERLVVTPSPFSYESLNGFLLRTVECNGYSSIGEMLRYAGVSDRELRTAAVPLDKIAALYGYPPERLGALSYYTRPHAARDKGFGIAGHPLLTTQVRTKDAKFCPECAKASGRITVFWSLVHAVACPVHKCRPISRCPVCKRALTWNRSGLLTCACGADLGQAAPDWVTDGPVVALMDAVRRKLLRLPLESPELADNGFPIAAIDGMSLRTLLQLVDRFGKAVETPGVDQAPAGLEYCRVKTAAAAFSRWPQGFYEFLHSIEELSPERVRKTDYFGLVKQFGLFHAAVFKAKIPRAEIEFIHDAFVAFGKTQWRQATIHKTLDSHNDAKTDGFIGIGTAAERIGVTPSTVRRLIAQQILRPTIIDNGRAKRYLFDATKPLPKRVPWGRSYTARVAAKMLGIPASVLQELRAAGLYRTCYLGPRIGVFHESDIRQFEQDMREAAGRARCDAPAAKPTTIGDIMNRRLRSAARKSAVFHAVADGYLKTYAVPRGALADIIVDGEAVEAFLNGRRTLGREVVAAYDAAIVIQCDPLAVPWLVAQGHLTAVGTDVPPRVTAASVDGFCREFVSCAALARERGCISRTVVRQLESAGVSLLQAERGRGKSLQRFVRRNDMALLKDGLR